MTRGCRHARCALDRPLPRDYQDLDSATGSDILGSRQIGTKRVVRFGEDAVVKYGDWEQVHAEEVICMRYAARLGLPVPTLIHYPGHAKKRVRWSMKLVFALIESTVPIGVWYICMSEVKGVPLQGVVDKLPNDALDRISRELRDIVRRIGRAKSRTITSVTGDPLRTLLVPRDIQPQSVFFSTGEFLDHFVSLYALRFGPSRAMDMQSMISPLPRRSSIYFTHGDLVPKNILVDPSEGYKISAILDWENAGFYPSFWEHSRMLDPTWMTPGWSRIIDGVFPHQRSQMETEALAVHGILVAFDEFRR